MHAVANSIISGKVKNHNTRSRIVQHFGSMRVHHITMKHIYDLPFCFLSLLTIPLDSRDEFTHILQCCFIGTGWLSMIVPHASEVILKYIGKT